MKPVKFKCRASMVGKIMTEAKGLTNYEKYLAAKQKIIDLTVRYEAYVDKTKKLATGIREVSLPKAKADVEKYDKIKHIIELSETCKTYLKEWIIEQKYNRRKEFASKFTDKGNLTEQDGFGLINELLYTNNFLHSNTQQFEDEYKCGRPDVVIADTVIDNKSSYTIFTFPFGETEITNKDYFYQGHAYMDLTGKRHFKLCYTLNNTPAYLIEKELKSWAWNNNIEFDKIPEKVAYDIVKNHVYTKDALNEFRYVFGTHDTSDFIELPKEKRLITFEMEYDREVIESINARVIICDEWVQENWDKF